MHHLPVCEESIRKGVCCIFSLMEYYLAILQISGEKVLQPRLTLKLITADSRSSQQQRTKRNANGCAKDCRKRPCCCLSCNIGLSAYTCEPFLAQGSSSLQLETRSDGENTQCPLFQWVSFHGTASLFILWPLWLQLRVAWFSLCTIFYSSLFWMQLFDFYSGAVSSNKYKLCTYSVSSLSFHEIHVCFLCLQ